MDKATLLASAPTLAQIEESITRFYCGEKKALAFVSEGTWAIRQLDGREISGVRVVKKGRRYRFEAVG